MDDDLWNPIDAATETRLFDMTHAPVTPIAVDVDLFTTPLADLDAFDLRVEIAHGLSLSDGLRVDVIDENTLMVIGTDSMKTRGLYLATGRLLHLTRDSKGEPWRCDRYEGCPLHGFGAHMICTLADLYDDLTDDLAWVRRRSDP
jgi:hypothetical protein